MSHTSKIPPAKYATSDLPTDLEVGSLVFDSDTSEHKVFNGSSWDVVSGESLGTATIASSNASTYDQIQGDIPASWKQNDSSLKGLVIGTSCTSIGGSAFNNCSGLTGSLVIPDSVTTIGSYAFYSCAGLTGSLTIPDSVTSISTGVFINCTGLTGLLTIGNSVTSIGSAVFSGCTGLTTAYLALPLANVGSGAFSNSGLTTVYAKDAVASGWTLGPGQTVGNKSGVTVIDWINYPDIP